MNKLFLYRLLIVWVMFLVWGYFYTLLPNEVPTHWGPNGLPDAYGSKLMNVVLFPVLTLFMVILFPILSKIDPKKENYEKFGKSWEIIQFAIIWFFAYIYFVILYLSLHANISISPFMLFGLWVLFMILGNYFGKIRQNYFIGIKLPWTLSNEEVWNKTHRVSGKLFVISGIIFLINSFLNLYPIWIFIISLLIIVVFPVVYAYISYKKIAKK